MAHSMPEDMGGLKADIDILRILNKYYYLVVEFKFVSEDMILLDVSAFTNVADAVKREGE